MRIELKLLLCASIAAVMLAVPGDNRGPAGADRAAPRDSIDLYRLGAMAQYDEDNFESAVREYADVIRLDPTHSFDHVNFGLALMENNRLEEALAEFEEAHRLDPRYTHIPYNLGIAFKRMGNYKQSAQWLAEASASDSSEPAIWYNLGIAYRRIGQIEAATRAFRRVLEINPYNANAHYNLMRIALSENDRETYEAEREVFRKLKEMEPPSDLPKQLEICQYSYMIDLKDALPAPEPYTGFGRAVPLRFMPAGGEFGLPGSGTAPAAADPSWGPDPAGLLAVDVDRDGYLDLLVCGPAADRLGIAGLYHNNAGMGFSRPGAGGPALDRVLLCMAADYDNDDDTDIYCLRRGANLLYGNLGGGRFAEVARGAGLDDPGWSVSAIFQDHDNDGDLDVLVADRSDSSGTGSGRIGLYRNNGDGTFSELAADMELVLSGGKVGALAALDYDNDNDSDLLVLGPDGSSLFSNRLWAPYERIAGAGGLASPASRAWIADCNNDGHMDVLARSPDGAGAVLLVNDGRGGFAKKGEWTVGAAGGPTAVWRWLDYDNDGYLDIAAASGAGIRLLRGGPGTEFTDATEATGLADAGAGGRGAWALEAVDADGDGDDDLVALGPRGLSLWRNDGGDANNSIVVSLRGQKNNHDGIGARVEVKAGRFYQKQEVRTPYLRFGVGSLERVDIVRVWWANNVIQNERGVPAGTRLEVLEKPGVLGSCPYVFSFDGRTYRFVTDALVTSTMGFFLAPDTWFPPDGDEYVIVPGEMADDSGGRVRLSVTEELREITYIDALKLHAVDVPAGKRPISNEIFRTAPPDFRLYAFPDKLITAPVYDSQGREVTDLIREADGRAVGGAKPGRYEGTIEPETLTIELGELASRADLHLILSGWVEWTNSSINRAIYQNPEATFTPPYLQALTGPGGGEGEWRTVLPEMGFPPGWFKTTVVDLSGVLPPNTRALRIATNLAINWDEIAFWAGKPETPALGPGRGPSAVRLEWRGYSRTRHGGDRPIDFLWDDPLYDAGWPITGGFYTDYGRVDHLVRERDGSCVVMNHGDALMAEFPAAPPPRRGCRRYYLLHLAGWCKDGDPNSLFSSTVLPMPADYPSRWINGLSTREGSPPDSSRSRLLGTPNVWESAEPD